MKKKRFCLDCGVGVVVGPRCRKCGIKAQPLKRCSECGAMTRWNPCRNCTKPIEKKPPTYCEDCGKENSGGRWCKSCAGKHQKEFKKEKPCSLCGRIGLQDPCPSCIQLANWNGNDKRRKLISQQQIKNWKDPEYRRRVSEGVSATWTEEKKEYYRELRKEYWTEERRQWQTEQNLAMWADPEFKAKMKEIYNREDVKQRRAEAAAKVQRRKWFNTSIEIATKEALRCAGIPFKFQHALAGKVYDFLLLGAKILIEVDGDYWHSLPANIENDKLKDRIAENHGFTLVRFAESEIEGVGALKLLQERVLPLLGEQPTIAVAAPIKLF